MRKLLGLGGGVLLAALVFVNAAAAGASGGEGLAQGGSFSGSILYTPDSLEWGPGPDALPPGALLTVLDGNPFEEGPFTLRAKLPAGYRIMPHVHPTTENVTVLSGKLFVGQGPDYDESLMKELGPGGYAHLLGGEEHYVHTGDKECTIQVSAMGPFQITYVNADDDPRN